MSFWNKFSTQFFENFLENYFHIILKNKNMNALSKEDLIEHHNSSFLFLFTN